MARQREVKWTQKVGPRIFTTMEKKKSSWQWAMHCSKCWWGKVSSYTMHGTQFAMNLNRQTCFCCKWDLCGLLVSMLLLPFQGNKGVRCNMWTLHTREKHMRELMKISFPLCQVKIYGSKLIIGQSNLLCTTNKLGGQTNAKWESQTRSQEVQLDWEGMT